MFLEDLLARCQLNMCCIVFMRQEHVFSFFSKVKVVISGTPGPKGCWIL
jgi:hypothetical protein